MCDLLKSEEWRMQREQIRDPGGGGKRKILSWTCLVSGTYKKFKERSNTQLPIQIWNAVKICQRYKHIIIRINNMKFTEKSGQRQGPQAKVWDFMAVYT